MSEKVIVVKVPGGDVSIRVSAIVAWEYFEIADATHVCVAHRVIPLEGDHRVAIYNAVLGAADK